MSLVEGVSWFLLAAYYTVLIKTYGKDEFLVFKRNSDEIMKRIRHGGFKNKAIYL